MGQVLFDLPGHLGVLVKLLGVEEGAASHPLLVPAGLRDVEHRRVSAALAEGPARAHGTEEGRIRGQTRRQTRRESGEGSQQREPLWKHN